MYKGRVLVVEDLSDVRATLSGLLSDEGYDVSSASSRVEALQKLEAERFHVAVLDVRLDEADEDNRDGIWLMHEITDKDPTVAIIILTGYADVKMVREALQRDRGGKSLAFGFLEKSEVGHLPEYVKRAFERAVRINADLVIQDPEQYLPVLPRRLQFVRASKPPKQQLIEEADELLRRLFFGCERIRIRPIQGGGYSGVAVLEVTPWYQDKGRGEVLIAKIGERFLVENEATRYSDLAQGLVGGHRLPKTLETAGARALSGILYTFAGLGAVRDFAAFYRSSDMHKILSGIENLFAETCFPWRRGSGFVCVGADLWQVYRQLLRLDPEKLQQRLDSIMGGRHPFRKGSDRQWLWLGDEVRLVNPVTFALSANLKTDYYVATIHGDLHGFNVLVDQHNETWLIDFANTCKGPLLYDYACFETFLRISMVQCRDWNLLYGWERALFNVSDLCDPALPNYLEEVSEIKKSHRAVLAVRRLALEEHMGETERTYLIGLLFSALKILTIMDLPPAQRDHALICAALIAERLKSDARG